MCVLNPLFNKLTWLNGLVFVSTILCSQNLETVEEYKEVQNETVHNSLMTLSWWLTPVMLELRAGQRGLGGGSTEAGRS